MHCQCKQGEPEREKSTNLLYLSSPQVLISATQASLGEDINDAKTVLLRTILLVLYKITKSYNFHLTIWKLFQSAGCCSSKYNGLQLNRSLSLSPIIIHAIENQTRLKPF